MKPPTWLPSLLGLLLIFATDLLSQQKQNAASKAVDWGAMIPQIQAAVAGEYCGGPRDDIDIIDTADLTGNETTEALVDYCHEGAYMDLAALIRLENGKPTVAKFRDEHGNAVDLSLMGGASVMHGAETKLLAKEHAVVLLRWDSDESDKFQCGGIAYVWNSHSKTFDIAPNFSADFVETECRKIRKIQEQGK